MARARRRFSVARPPRAGRPTAVSTYVSELLRSRIEEADRRRCQTCLTSEANSGIPLTCDHITPVSKGGPTSFENVCLACRPGGACRRPPRAAPPRRPGCPNPGQCRFAHSRRLLGPPRRRVRHTQHVGHLAGDPRPGRPGAARPRRGLERFFVVVRGAVDSPWRLQGR
ncbi:MULTISPECIES: HNH endonuclease [Sorangium]|uniref:HNH endonuclease n=1 Tax=Sorangium TaxID=39643 RepID=UPI003D9C1DFE